MRRQHPQQNPGTTLPRAAGRVGLTIFGGDTKLPCREGEALRQAQAALPVEPLDACKGDFQGTAQRELRPPIGHVALPQKIVRPGRVAGARLRRQGISLIELLVTIAIIALLVAVSFPAFSALRASTQGLSGQTTIATTLTNARSLSMLLAHRYEDLDDDLPYSHGREYAGTAVIFYADPDPERSDRVLMQLLVSDPTASIGVPEDALSSQFLQNQTPKRHGFAAMVGRDPVVLAGRNIGVAGLTTLDGDLRAISLATNPARFAVRFGANGRMDMSDDFIYVNDREEEGVFRSGSGYNDDPDFSNRKRVPVVQMLALFDTSLSSYDPSWNDTAGSARDLRNWLLDSARTEDEVLLFSVNPNTGQLMR